MTVSQAPTPVLRTLGREDLRALATSDPAEARAWWARTLGGDDGRPVLLSLLEEWAEYSGQSYPEMLETIFTAKDRAAAQWERSRPETAEEAAGFYDATDTITPLLLWWHATGPRPPRCAAAAAGLVRATGGRRILDFGGGIGSTSLALASEGHEVVLAEISGELLSFAAHRFRRRGHVLELLDLRTSGLGDLEAASVDGACVFDVFEHLPDAIPACRDIDRLLRPGGVVCFNQVFVPPEDEPGHYPRRGEVLRWFHARGYRLAHVTGVCWAAQKAALPPRARLAQGLEIRTRIRVASAVEGRTGPAGRRLAFYGVRHAVD